MSVIITDMDMPKGCQWCEFGRRFDNESCMCDRKPFEPRVFDNEGRPDFCPIKETIPYDMKLYRKLIRPMHSFPGPDYSPRVMPIEAEVKWYPEEEREQLENKYASYNEGPFSDLIFEEKFEPYICDSAVTNKEKILDFIKKIIPDNFQCKHLSLRFSENGEDALLIMTNRELEDSDKEDNDD